MTIIDSIRRLLGFGNGDRGADQNGGTDGSTPCEHALSRLYEYLDGELGSVSHEQVRAHLEHCQRCYPHLCLEKMFRGALQQAFESGRAPDRLRSRIQELIEQEEG